MLKNLFITHPVLIKHAHEADGPFTDAERGGHGDITLKRFLDAKHLIMLGVGGVIGAGIFVLTGTAAAQYAGPALIISFIIAGATCALAALCYAEFASMLPVSGGAYAYSYATLGEMVAWFVGWNLVLEYMLACSTVAVGWSAYFNEMLHLLSGWIGVDLTLPGSFVSAPFSFNTDMHLVTTGALLNIPAILIIAALSWLCYRGITQSATANAVIVTIKVAVIVLFLVVTFHYIQPSLWHPFIPPNEGGTHYGWSGVIRGASVVFFGYLGFDAISTAAGETKNPRRNMPIGILGALLVCTILYMSMSAALTGLAPFRNLNTAEPVATAINYVLSTVHMGSTARFVLKALKVIVVFGALAGLSSVVLVTLFAQSRIFYSMSQDGLLPESISKLHGRSRTPYLSTIFAGIVCATLASLFPISVLGDMVSMGTLLAFAIVCLGVLVLRYTRPELPRTFRVPMAGLICPLATAACLFLFWRVFSQRWWLFLGWTLIGLLIYGFYGYHHSKLRRSASFRSRAPVIVKEIS